MILETDLQRRLSFDPPGGDPGIDSPDNDPSGTEPPADTPTDALTPTEQADVDALTDYIAAWHEASILATHLAHLTGRLAHVVCDEGHPMLADEDDIGPDGYWTAAQIVFTAQPIDAICDTPLELAA